MSQKPSDVRVCCGRTLAKQFQDFSELNDFKNRRYFADVKQHLRGAHFFAFPSKSGEDRALAKHKTCLDEAS